MKVIIISMLVSIVTLVILLFNKTKPLDIAIPSWFLGSKESESPQKLFITKPPWFLWLLVLFATLGAAIAYLPPNREGRGDAAAQNVLVWFDDTLSAQLAYRSKNFSSTDLMSALLEPGYSLFSLESAYRFTEKEIDFNYYLKEITSAADIEKKITVLQNQPPSPFARPLRIESLLKILGKDSRFSNGKGELLIVSDGQRNTLRNLLPLREAFAKVRLFSLPEPTDLVGTKEEIIPLELAEAWGINSSRQNTGDFTVIDSSDERVPQYARPNIFRETFFEKDNKFSVFSNYSEQKIKMPLLTVCRSPVSGVLENDSLGELRVFLQFFGGVFRFEDCVEASHDPLAFEKQPWKFRRASLWVIPIESDIADTLALGRLWIPMGYQQGDGIIYVASSRLDESGRALTNEALVQVEENLPPFVLFLAPLPHEENLFFRSKKEPAVKVSFKPMLIAADKTPLAFKATTENIYYLRTTLSMPNSELSRLAIWSKFWLEISKTISGNSPSLHTVELADVASLSLSSLGDIEDSLAGFRLALSPETLRFEKYSFKDSGIRSGIFLNPSSFEYVFFNVSAEERNPDFISQKEFESTWQSASTPIEDREKIKRERRVVPLLGALLAIVALLLLWFPRKRPITTLGKISLFSLFLLGGLREKAFAQFGFPFQNVVPTASVPFRISWCALDAPPRVVGRYRELRETLAFKGTIRLPREILVGQCKPGASEIWWTDSLNTLPPSLETHLAGGGFFVAEGYDSEDLPLPLQRLAIPSIGQVWEAPAKRGMLFRSFYLLHSFDGCAKEKTQILRLKKKVNAQVPLGLVTSVRFLSAGSDCFNSNEEYRLRSFVNMMYAILTTDYKEDHMQLPELLSRIRNLGLEP